MNGCVGKATAAVIVDDDDDGENERDGVRGELVRGGFLEGRDKHSGERTPEQMRLRTSLVHTCFALRSDL